MTIDFIGWCLCVGQTQNKATTFKMKIVCPNLQISAQMLYKMINAVQRQVNLGKQTEFSLKYLQNKQ